MINLLQKSSLGTAIIILLIIGIGYRFAGLHTPMQQDEVRHNAILLGAKNIQHLKDRMEAHTQPLLAYMQKKYIWLDVILPTTNETSLKITSALYSSASLIIVAAFFWYRKRYLLSFLSISTLAVAIQEIDAASNARHYAYISLTSTLFILSYYDLLFEKGKKKFQYINFYASGFLVINAHLFTWPVIGLCFLHPIILRLIARKNIAAYKHLAISTSILLSSIILNWFIIDRLWNKGHHFSHEASTDIRPEKLADYFLSFFSQFSTPFNYQNTILIFFSLLIINLFFIYRNSIRRDKLYFYLSIIAGLLFTLIIAMVKSKKTISLRYVICYSPMIAIITASLINDTLCHIKTLLNKVDSKEHWKKHIANTVLLSAVICSTGLYTAHQIKNLPHNLERRSAQSAFVNRDFITPQEKRKNTKIRLNSGIKSISLKIRKEKASAIAFELSDHGHLAQWEMYNKYLYRDSHPKSRIRYYYYGDKGRKEYLKTADRLKSPNYVFRDKNYDKYYKPNLSFLKKKNKYDYLLIYNYYKNPYLKTSFKDLKGYKVEKDVQGISIQKTKGKINRSDIIKVFNYLDIPQYE